MISFNKYLSQRIEETRKEKNIRVSDILEKSPISFAVYRHIRLGIKKHITLKLILKILKAMEVKPSDFFDDNFVSEEIDFDS